MQQVLYAKYNKMRKDEFQIRTAILRGEDGVWVEKSAVRESGTAHIAKLSLIMKRLRHVLPM